jgi:hypothetical protein
MNYLQPIVVALTIGLVTWIATVGCKSLRLRRDGRAIHRWLAQNTLDEPGESHKSLGEISDGTRLPADRVRLACLKHSRIFQSLDEPEHYGIWRKEPESVYDRHDVRSV